jgi:hypothetical protein
MGERVMIWNRADIVSIEDYLARFDTQHDTEFLYMYKNHYMIFRSVCDYNAVEGSTFSEWYVTLLEDMGDEAMINLYHTMEALVIL